MAATRVRNRAAITKRCAERSEKEKTEAAACRQDNAVLSFLYAFQVVFSAFSKKEFILLSLLGLMV